MPIDSMYLSQLLGGTFCICDTKQFVVSVFFSPLRLFVNNNSPYGILSSFVSQVDVIVNHVCSDRDHILPRAHDGFRLHICEACSGTISSSAPC